MKTIHEISKNETLNKVSRFEARISHLLHARIKKIAKLQHRTVTDFATSALEEALTKAEKELEQQQIMIFSIIDQEVFLNALLCQLEPNEALKRAFAYHEKMVTNG
jgi:uncharacterized protein (DUF1778 family)